MMPGFLATESEFEAIYFLDFCCLKLKYTRLDHSEVSVISEVSVSRHCQLSAGKSR
jgi:hypothetical protein